MAVILIGFMGVGKTTIGSQLAEKLSIPFIDLDESIVKNEQMTIPEIFNTYGEDYFRQKEYEGLKHYINMEVVIATGGGIVENPNNIELFKKNKLNIWVDTNFNTVYNRIVGDINRPNASHKSFDEIKKLYNRRFSRYNEIAYIKVRNDDDVKLCVQEIHNLIQTDDEN
ncbi:shikimate kinase [Macrococcoides caseolyticum]|uniref:shikimate kinase n=1 Tax=Macrococcoides caseolyticum TaxID=69966 RepID=UPI001F1E7A72|nr:shikimate kinase [Macrococcus caseolyticus]MCE4956105.1 shikimate kinase [Macrococcus caseolyticus]